MLVYCTVPDIAQGKTLAAHLLREKLAACVNLVPSVVSMYYWDGKLEEENEQLMLIKTNSDTYQELEAEIKKHHPYDVPEIIGVSVAKGLPSYLHWVVDQLEKNQ